MFDDRRQESLAREQALRLLYAIPIEAVRKFRSICVAGDPNIFDGHRFNSCYYGTVSMCLGHNYIGKTQDEVIKEVIAFARTFDVELNEHKTNAIEDFCMKLNPRRLDLLVLWCDEVIRQRENPAWSPSEKQSIREFGGLLEVEM